MINKTLPLYLSWEGREDACKMEVERNAPVSKMIRRVKARPKVVVSVAAAPVRVVRGAKKAARRAAAEARTSQAVKTTTSAAVARVVPRREEKTLLGHLASVVVKAEGPKRPGVPQALNWLRRPEELAREPRPIGAAAAQKSHSAERQPHCLCPACGRAMEGALMMCPECTMRAARLFKVRPKRVSLTSLLSQAVSP